MKKIAIFAMSGLALWLPMSPSMAAGSGCGKYTGKNYVICKESRFSYDDGEDHPGPSSASGPYGLLDGTRSAYRKDARGNVVCAYSDDDCIAENYVRRRYGSWEAAASFHRRNNWW